MVLLVEDEWLLRMEIADAMDERGWNVKEAASGEAALAILETGSPVDLVVTDIRLPGRVTGWDVAEAFRTAHSDVSIIYCSGNPPVPGRQVDHSVFLTKPCRTEDVLEAGEDLCPDFLPRQ